MRPTGRKKKEFSVRGALCFPAHPRNLEGAGSRVCASLSTAEPGNTAEEEGADVKRLPESPSRFLKMFFVL